MALLTLRTAPSGTIRIRLVETGSGEFIIISDNVAVGLYSVGADMRTKDREHADRMFDRAVEIANAGLLKHPAWRAPQTIVIREA